MPDTSVKRIHESMRGAPVLNGVAGSLIGLLDTFLVNGWGLATANSLSVSGGVATLTMPAGSEFEDHCVVLIAGATPAALNGEQRIATTNGTTLTFPTTAPDGPATGTITVKYAPRGSISGVVRINGQLPTQPYRVRSHRAEDGLLVVETWCAAGTGAYTVSDLELGMKHVNIAYDHTGTFPCVATAPLEPTP